MRPRMRQYGRRHGADRAVQVDHVEIEHAWRVRLAPFAAKLILYLMQPSEQRQRVHVAIKTDYAVAIIRLRGAWNRGGAIPGRERNET